MYCKTMHKSKNVLEADPSDIAMTMKLTTSTPTTSATEHNGADIDLDDKRYHRFEVHATIGDEEVVYFVCLSPTGEKITITDEEDEDVERYEGVVLERVD